jgi:hypothetical protein
VKLRKLELLSLEDRSVPAFLNAYATATELAPAPNEPTDFVSAAVVSKMVAANKTETSSVTTLGKLAANHNQTLVRDRRRGKSCHG